VKGKIKLVKCDLSNKGEWIEEFKNVDWVFHLASLADIVPSIQNPESYFHSNVDATFYVLEAARHNNIKRFVYSASSSCYGIPDEYPTPEQSPIQPQYPYALAKRMGEELVEHWSQLYNLPAISLRFFNVYGTRSRTSGTYGAVFGVFLAQKLANKPYTVVGDGNQTRDFTYVTDIVSALIAAAESEKTNKIYNVGSDTTVSINKIVELLGGDKIHIPKRPGEPDCTYADISKIKNELGWHPTITIEEGVEKILENIDYWRQATVWEPESIADATSDWFKYLDK
jgi:UDP-glucose 4-epimerase